MGPACLNCFAAKQAATLHQQAGATRRTVPQYAGITGRKKGRYFFNGRVTALEPGHDEWKWPLRWRGAEHPLLGPGQRSLIFVVGMADLFYDRPEHLIGRTLTTIAASEHIGLILTQRPDAMAKYFARLPASVVPRWQEHLWLGFTGEKQKQFNERWAPMRDLAGRGWRTFVSIAPMLEPVTLPPDFLAFGRHIWVIVSGEQGAHEVCRDMDPQWARAVLKQCRGAGVPFFLKQMARRRPIPPDLFVRQFPEHKR